MAGISKWFRRPTVAERLAPFDLRPDVVAAAGAMASDRRSDPYVVALGSCLSDSESVLRMMDARHAGEMGLLVLTTERILFCPRRRPGETSLSVPLASVREIEASTVKVSGTVHLTTRDGSLIVDQILGTQGEMLADDAREAMRGTPPGKHDPLQVLAELRALRDAGMISDGEFEARKSALWREI